MTPAELTASEYLKLHVYPTLVPVGAPPPFFVPCSSPRSCLPASLPAAVLACARRAQPDTAAEGGGRAWRSC